MWQVNLLNFHVIAPFNGPFVSLFEVTISYVLISLSQVDSRDYVFPRAPSPHSEKLQEGRSEELMDKEVRAVFLCLFTYLLGDYQNYVTVIRFKPPSFYFNKVSVETLISDWCTLISVTKVSNLAIFKERI